MNLFSIELKWSVGNLPRVNKSIHDDNFAIGKDVPRFIWHGPLVAVMKRILPSSSSTPTDITLEAYRDVLDYLDFYNGTTKLSAIERHSEISLSEEEREEMRHGIVIGVRVNCAQTTKSEPEIAPVEVPKTHPIFDQGASIVCDIPAMFGRFIHSRQCAFPSLLDTPDEALDKSNATASMMLTKSGIRELRWAAHDASTIDTANGNVLFVDNGGSGDDLSVEELLKWRDLIKDIAVPFIARNNPALLGAEYRLGVALKHGARSRGLISEDDSAAFSYLPALPAP